MRIKLMLQFIHRNKLIGTFSFNFEPNQILYIGSFVPQGYDTNNDFIRIGSQNQLTSISVIKVKPIHKYQLTLPSFKQPFFASPLFTKTPPTVNKFLPKLVVSHNASVAVINQERHALQLANRLKNELAIINQQQAYLPLVQRHLELNLLHSRVLITNFNKHQPNQRRIVNNIINQPSLDFEQAFDKLNQANDDLNEHNHVLNNQTKQVLKSSQNYLDNLINNNYQNNLNNIEIDDYDDSDSAITSNHYKNK